ncbi:hypothetical protein [Flavobacterium sp. A45]|uniref:hypothetical protein n=1 Tax=Flavobacterium sp. A45 TaxID=1945862 RepID=UPI0009841807|nr:hypothetical protein [Flavobacterium sp. A45]OOG71606.1 hypothetical protein B0E44_09865 [Flavobacterium sp. A45]
MSDKQSLGKKLENELENELEKDEVLIWSDYPKQSFQIVFEDLIIIPFLTIIFFIGVYLLIMVLNFDANKDLIIFSIFTVVISILLINYRYVQKVNIQKKSIYGLTSKRVIIIANNKIKSLDLIHIKEISFVEHPFNFKYGSVIFGEPENIFGSSNEPFKFNNRGGLNLKRDDFAFDFITDTKKIYHLIESKINK